MVSAFPYFLVTILKLKWIAWRRGIIRKVLQNCVYAIYQHQHRVLFPLVTVHQHYNDEK